MGTISQVLNLCLQDFAELTGSGALERFENEVSRRRWLDELGRLRVWSGNIGAHQTGQSSLDYRLRDASHLKSETIRLLNRMLRLLHDLAELINEEPEDEVVVELEDDEEDDTTEAQQLHQSMVDIINCLFQISMAARTPADHDRLLAVRIKNEAYFEPWAELHISHKFADADKGIMSRLAAAMARQKAILKYRERHRAKLRKGLFDYVETDSTKLSETVATEIVSEKNHLDFLDNISNSGVSQTSYATSLMETQAATSIPNPPKGAYNRMPFECPYCFHIVTVKHKKDWAQHVFRDISPYVCLSKDCTTPSRLYESRHHWCFHMRQEHSKGTSQQDEAICPLCFLAIQPLSSFDKHVGRHLEELALFVLPRPDPDEEKEEDGESTGGDFENSHDDSDADLEPVENSNFKPDDVSLDSSSDNISNTPTDNSRLTGEFMEPKPLAERIETSSSPVEGQDEGQIDIDDRTSYWSVQEQRDFPLLLASHGQDFDAISAKLKSKSPSMVRNYFCKQPDFVRANFKDIAKHAENRNSHGEPDDADLKKRLESLGQDVILDLNLHGTAEEGEASADVNTENPGHARPLGFTYMPPELIYRDGEYRDRVEAHYKRLFDTAETSTAADVSNGGEEDFISDQGNKMLLPDYDKAVRQKGQPVSQSPQSPSKGSLSFSYTFPRRRHEVSSDKEIATTAPVRLRGHEKEGQSEETQRYELAQMHRYHESFTAIASGTYAFETRYELDGKLTPDRENLDVPLEARWTKISRQLVSPQALRDGFERFEEKADDIVVNRVLTKDEIQKYAERTREIQETMKREVYRGRAMSEDLSDVESAS